MLEILKVLTAYIQMTTGMPALERMPVVEQWTECAIAGQPDDCVLEGQHAGAMYVIPLNKIIIPDTFDLNDVTQVSILLHELVHAQQQADKRMFAASCIERELQAYRVQMHWLTVVMEVRLEDTIKWTDASEGAIASCAINQNQQR